MDVVSNTLLKTEQPTMGEHEQSLRQSPKGTESLSSPSNNDEFSESLRHKCVRQYGRKLSKSLFKSVEAPITASINDKLGDAAARYENISLAESPDIENQITLMLPETLSSTLSLGSVCEYDKMELFQTKISSELLNKMTFNESIENQSVSNNEIDCNIFETYLGNEVKQEIEYESLEETIQKMCRKSSRIQKSLKKPINNKSHIEDSGKGKKLKRKYKKTKKIKKTKYKGEMVFKCPQCDYYHPKLVSSLKRHMLKHQSDDSIQWFYCELCSYKGKRRSNLMSHMRLHRDPDEIVWYQCEICPKKFKYKNALNDHKKRHKGPEELNFLECNICSYKTPFKHTLLRHQIAHVPPEKSKLLKCDKCSYTTYNKYYFSRHNQNTHAEPIYMCVFCNYEAKYKSCLESHVKHQHLPKNQMEYCNFCDFSTTKRWSMLIHKKKAHANIKPEIFYCYNCSYHTRFKRCLVKHMTMHGTRIGIKIKTEKLDA